MVSFGYILKSGPTRFAGGLNLGEKRIKDDSMVLDLSNSRSVALLFTKLRKTKEKQIRRKDQELSFGYVESELDFCSLMGF